MALVTIPTNHFKVINDNTGDRSDSPTLWHIAERFMKPLVDIRSYYLNNESFNNGYRIYLLTSEELKLAGEQETSDEDYDDQYLDDEIMDDEDIDEYE